MVKLLVTYIAEVLFVILIVTQVIVPLFVKDKPFFYSFRRRKCYIPMTECPSCHKNTKNVDEGIGIVVCECCGRGFNINGKTVVSKSKTNKTKKT